MPQRQAAAEAHLPELREQGGAVFSVSAELHAVRREDGFQLSDLQLAQVLLVRLRVFGTARRQVQLLPEMRLCSD